MRNSMDNSIKEDKKAKYYEDKINLLKNNNSISSDDPQAIKKLEIKLKSLIDYKAKVKAREHRPYELQNLNQQIRNVKERIKQLKELEKLKFNDIIFTGGKVIHNKEQNRIQFIFNDIPDETIRTLLKHNGFKWAKSQGAWQRLFNKNGIYATNRILETITENIQI